MARRSKKRSGGTRNILAYIILGFSLGGILGIAIVAIVLDPSSTMTVFNVVLPVFASWVGTVLAYYFGRENFESASQEVRKMVDRLSPEERSETPVKAVMRPLADMVYFQFREGEGEADVQLSALIAELAGSVSRLPILNELNKPMYMIHGSNFDKHIASGGKSKDTLAAFLESQRSEGFEFGLDRGFVVVSAQTSLAAAKSKMEAVAPVQDIYITENGSSEEALIGWISNLRLVKFLEA